jgi:hypothetical protein
VLRSEVTAGHLDPAIVDFFVDKGIYKIFEKEPVADEGKA